MNMKKISIIAFALLCILPAELYSQMTDAQVVEYVKSGVKSGKSQDEITRELLARGLNATQARRIKDQYSGATASLSSDPKESLLTRNARQSQSVSTSASDYPSTSSSDFAPFSADEFSKANAASGQALSPNDKIKVFGHDVFAPKNGGLSFEPNENIPTPEDYKLGPGDEVIIDIWGYNEARISQVISPEGRISISQIGPVYLSGLTIAEAAAKIRKVLSAKYSGIQGANSDVSVTLGAIRTIQVNVMGDVNYPGAYRLSSFSTVFTALYAAGGVTDTGSLRAIQVVRGSRKIASVDIYGYLFNGTSESDVRLQDGDVIIVPAYVSLVTVDGGVKRPMTYEMKEGETVADLISYAGGFAGNAFTDNVSVLRTSGHERKILTASVSNNYSVTLCDGDAITVGNDVQDYSNRLVIKGFVINPGYYELGMVNTVAELVAAAGGLKEDAFLNRAVIRRYSDDLSMETVSVDIGAVLKGTIPDIPLQRGDVLTVYGKYEINPRGTLTINGLVLSPGVFNFRENTTVEDLIVMAGGLLDGASMSKVDVSRRIVDPYSLEVSNEIGKSFSFSIKDGLAIDGADSFYLEPYDVVSVRRSPSYMPQQFVTAEGEVVFPGQYVLQTKGERLSSIITRAGGITSKAYLRGAKLTRRMTEEELDVARSSLELARMNAASKTVEESGRRESVKDTSNLSKFAVQSTYTIAVDFGKALSNPGSDDDIILREGDLLSIPENSGTVAIKGEVLYPNTVIYTDGQPISHYISMAGGFTEKARRSKLYVVYQNGRVCKGANSKLEPGCEIIIPARPERRTISASEILSIGTTTTSLATMMVTLLNIVNRN